MFDIDAAREEFVAGYREAMLWANAYLDDDNSEAIDGRDYAEPEDVEREDADTFWDTLGYVIMAIDCGAYSRNSVHSAGQAGHDFALTRNHHGAGFWDRGLGRIGDMLTDEAHAYGSHYIAISDDGTVANHG